MRPGDDPKPRVRRALRSLRAALSPAFRAQALGDIDLELARWIARSGLTPRDGAVALFAHGPNEAGPTTLAAQLRAQGWRTAFPRVDPKTDMLTFCQVNADSELAPGWRGLLEPTEPTVLVPPASFAIVLVPGLAFDPFGGRLGQGGGHYDRFLSQLPAQTITVGVAFACQLVPRVPMDPWDVPLSVTITEAGAASSRLSEDRLE